MKKVMNKKDFIDKHILPMESKETIIGYLQGEVDFDENFRREHSSGLRPLEQEDHRTFVQVRVDDEGGVPPRSSDTDLTSV